VELYSFPVATATIAAAMLASVAPLNATALSPTETQVQNATYELASFTPGP